MEVTFSIGLLCWARKRDSVSHDLSVKTRYRPVLYHHTSINGRRKIWLTATIGGYDSILVRPSTDARYITKITLQKFFSSRPLSRPAVYIAHSCRGATEVKTNQCTEASTYKSCCKYESLVIDLWRQLSFRVLKSTYINLWNNSLYWSLIGAVIMSPLRDHRSHRTHNHRFRCNLEITLIKIHPVIDNINSQISQYYCKQLVVDDYY